MSRLRSLVPRLIFFLAILGAILGALRAQAAEPFMFREGRHKQGELKYINGLPVLIVRGTPAEIGEQEAVLTAQVAQDVMAYPKEVLSLIGREDSWLVGCRDHAAQQDLAARLQQALDGCRGTAGDLADYLRVIETFAD